MKKGVVLLTEESLPNIIAQGEDSFVEFKSGAIEASKLKQALVAFSNHSGGLLIFGVDDGKNIVGVENEKQIEQLILSCRDQIKPPLSMSVSNHTLAGKRIVCISIPVGAYKPYCTNDGRYFIRHGASNRIMSQEELQRAFQSGKRLAAEEMAIPDSGFDNINKEAFVDFYRKTIDEELSYTDNETIKEKLRNLKCTTAEGNLTYLGALLFGKEHQGFLSAFSLEAIAYVGLDVSVSEYRSNASIKGNLHKMYEEAKNFILTNVPHPQGKQGFNSLGLSPISPIALEELLTNALLHRDYFIKAPIRVFIFDDRVEIRSPGSLPNSLTIENIEEGVPARRNEKLCQYAHQGGILPYRGVNSGIKRAKKAQPGIKLINKVEGIGEFIAIIPLQQQGYQRLAMPEATAPVAKDELDATQRLQINLLIGGFNDLRGEMLAREPQLADELEVLGQSLRKLPQCRDKESLIRSGALHKVRRFIDSLVDGSTKLGKTIGGLEKCHEIVSELGNGYNSIAEWTGLPQIPKLLLKKGK